MANHLTPANPPTFFLGPGTFMFIYVYIVYVVDYSDDYYSDDEWPGTFQYIYIFILHTTRLVTVVYDSDVVYGWPGPGCVLSRAATAVTEDCVICLSEPRDTAVLPCRHMCGSGGSETHVASGQRLHANWRNHRKLVVFHGLSWWFHWKPLHFSVGCGPCSSRI